MNLEYKEIANLDLDRGTYAKRCKLVAIGAIEFDFQTCKLVYFHWSKNEIFGKGQSNYVSVFNI